MWSLFRHDSRTTGYWNYAGTLCNEELQDNYSTETPCVICVSSMAINPSLTVKRESSQTNPKSYSDLEVFSFSPGMWEWVMEWPFRHKWDKITAELWMNYLSIFNGQTEVAWGNLIWSYDGIKKQVEINLSPLHHSANEMSPSQPQWGKIRFPVNFSQWHK